MIFEATRNSDQTEGRGQMRGFAWFDDIAEAVKAVKGEGVQGHGDGTVYLLHIATTPEQIREYGMVVRREEVYGPSWRGKDGGKGRYAPGWDPRGQDPEWDDYVRLREKFEGA